MQRVNVVVVDPFSSGLHLAEAMHQKGWQCYALITLPEKAQALAPVQDYFTEVRLYQDNIEELRQHYTDKAIDHVIAGSESGVFVADLLADSLGLAGNGATTSELRRNKFQMQNALAEQGIRAIQQFLAKTPEQAVAAAEKIHALPIVVKPTESAGTDGVYFCYSTDEVLQAFDHIYQQKNLYGQLNDAVLIQEYIAGDEYIVDVVVQNGVVRTGGIFIYEKETGPNGAPIYRSINLLPYHGEVQAVLLAYAKQVLPALGVKHGPAHIEIKMEQDKLVPVLIELGARMHGGYGPVFSRYGSGVSQLDLVLALLAGVDFTTIAEGYELSRRTLELFMISKQAGKVRDWAIEALLPTLPSVQWWSIWAKESGYIQVTKDLYSSPGVVVFSHDDESVIAKDLDKFLKEEEHSHLFVLS